MTDSEIDDKEILLRLKELKDDAAKGAYYINPDESFVKDLISGLLTNQKRYGFESCPCRLTVGGRAENLDIICPCDYRDIDLSEYGCCYCALYVSKDIFENKKKAESIPDRRFENKENSSETTAESSKGCRVLNLKYPVYRCKVCGYLCSRELPPDKCPICKVDSDRFEKYF